MSGRYAFSLPEPQPRDGWFRLGNIDVTTTVLITLIGIASMFVYALSPTFLLRGTMDTEAVQSGELWRLLTWPLVNPPSLWNVLDLLIFWYFGRSIEDEVGRKPYTWIVLAMTVVPATVVSIVGLSNEVRVDRWQTVTAGVGLFAATFFLVYALDRPGLRTFFNIPLWILGVVFLGIQVLNDLAYRSWANLIMLLGTIAIAMFGTFQRGMLEDLTFIPRVRWLSGPRPSPYGELGSARPKQKRKRGRGGAPRGGADVVAGPWQPTGGPTPLEQAELDVLLDRISEGGIDSLSPQEKARLQELSRRMRDS